MIKKNQKRNKNKLTIILMIIITLFLVTIVGLLLNNYMQKPQSEPYVNTDDWKSYTDKDLPYIFDYPSDMHFEKMVYEPNNLASNGPNHPAGYKKVTLNGLKGNSKDTIISIRYENGSSGINQEASAVCKSKELIQIKSALTSTNARICDGNKEWIFEEEADADGKTRDRIRVYSGKDANLDTSVFKKIVDSIRKQ